MMWRDGWGRYCENQQEREEEGGDGDDVLMREEMF